MKNLLLLIIVAVIASCNVPENGKEENVPTSKLEVLTNLSDEDTAKAVKDTTAHSETH